MLKIYLNFKAHLLPAFALVGVAYSGCERILTVILLTAAVGKSLITLPSLHWLMLALNRVMIKVMRFVFIEFTFFFYFFPNEQFVFQNFKMGGIHLRGL